MPAASMAAPAPAQASQLREAQLPQRRPASEDAVDAEDDEEVSRAPHARPHTQACARVRADTSL